MAGEAEPGAERGLGRSHFLEPSVYGGPAELLFAAELLGSLGRGEKAGRDEEEEEEEHEGKCATQPTLGVTPVQYHRQCGNIVSLSAQQVVHCDTTGSGYRCGGGYDYQFVELVAPLGDARVQRRMYRCTCGLGDAGSLNSRPDSGTVRLFAGLHATTTTSHNH